MSGGQFFQKNLTVLRTINEEQAEAVAGAASKLLDRIYPCRKLNDGFVETYVPSLTDGSTFRLFPDGSPKDEVKRWADSLNVEANGDHAVILLGMGLGYHPMAVLDRLPENGALALVEPDALLFLTAFVHVDLSRLLSDRRLHLFVGQTIARSIEAIGREMKWGRFMALNHQVAAVPLLMRVQPSFGHSFADQWNDALKRETMYRNSRVQHSQDVVKNTVANADALMRLPGVERLFGRFEGAPAVSVAPGPSLNDNFDVLKALQGRALIACVNSAYPILRRSGIDPDIVFTMDHSERNVKSFDEDAPPPNAVLIADPRIHPRIIRHFEPNACLASWRTTTEVTGDPKPVGQIPVPKRSGNALSLWLQSIVGEKGDVFGPGSVAVVGFHILARMGCGPIALLGQDLALQGERAYADGTIFDDKALPRDDAPSRKVPGVDGGEVAVTETLHLYRKLLEHEIARFGRPVYNLSAGAAIAGAPAINPQSFLNELPPLEQPIATMFSEAVGGYQPVTNRKVLRERLRDAARDLDEFARMAREGINGVPADESDETPGQKQARASELEALSSQCAEAHPLAMELLNELLQPAHFEHDDSRWRTQTLPFDQAAEERLRASIRVLDSFVTQSDHLRTLLLKKAEMLEN